jgi:hypothetical protein
MFLTKDGSLYSRKLLSALKVCGTKTAAVAVVSNIFLILIVRHPVSL